MSVTGSQGGRACGGRRLMQSALVHVLAFALMAMVLGLVSTAADQARASTNDGAAFPVFVQFATGQFAAVASQNYIFDTATGKRSKVLPSSCGGLRFSPSGDRALALCLAATVNNPTALSGLYIFYPSSRKPLRLVLSDPSQPVESGAFSPNGRTVVYVQAPRNSTTIATHLFRIPAIGGRPKQLTFGLAADADPIYTPNGRWILFERTNTKTQDVTLMAVAADGGSPHPLGISPHGSGQLVGGVSPDGATLLWRDVYALHSEGFDDSKAIVTANPTDQVLLPDISGGAGLWSPDGKEIGYGRQSQLTGLPDPHAAIANADGSGQRVISRDSAGHASLIVTWLPASAAAKWLH